MSSSARIVSEPAVALRVVLFDIDGTILWSDGAGRRAVFQALEEHFGKSGPGQHRFDGKTDPQIVRELMRHAGVSDADIDARIDEVLDRYLALLREELAAAEHGRHVFPGVHELLDALESRDDVVLGLLTGNIHLGAHAKLAAVGIDPGRFVVGAFGSDHHERPELPEIARRRAERALGHPVSGRDLVVIGDTPADVACGVSIGARAIGVATGRYTVEELRACDAAAVFADLTDTAAVVRAILAD
ncbi:MAG TPA: haloacid dehalogenase-like hydrolase [Gemmatimonadaceae bacterium]|nr:haloacid dehalogenase-like hydrolase [Gemmatimonadaceae bacterium]